MPHTQQNQLGYPLIRIPKSKSNEDELQLIRRNIHKGHDSIQIEVGNDLKEHQHLYSTMNKMEGKSFKIFKSRIKLHFINYIFWL
jgi:hypothetical protein